MFFCLWMTLAIVCVQSCWCCCRGGRVVAPVIRFVLVVSVVDVVVVLRYRSCCTDVSAPFQAKGFGQELHVSCITKHKRPHPGRPF